MTVLVAMIAVQVANLVNSCVRRHVPHCTVLLVSLQVQERSMDLYLHEILFMLCLLYHFDSFTLGCLGIKPWDVTCTSKFYCNSWAASAYHVMLHKGSFLATSQFCAWRPLYDFRSPKAQLWNNWKWNWKCWAWSSVTTVLCNQHELL